VEITSRRMNDVTILELVGPLVTDPADPARSSLCAAIDALVAEGRLAVVLHLGFVTDIDAHGIGELAWSFGTLRVAGGQMAVIAPSDHVVRMLSVTHPNRQFALHESEDEAVAAIRRKQAADIAEWRPVPIDAEQSTGRTLDQPVDSRISAIS
jgi:anti-anti-sigma regulatory factor